MPKDFERCVINGGRVRTKTLSDGRYFKICFIDGKSYKGHTHNPKKKTKVKKRKNKKKKR